MTDVPPIRVVFVEDDEDVRLGSAQALELAGFEVEGYPTSSRRTRRSSPACRPWCCATSSCPA